MGKYIKTVSVVMPVYNEEKYIENCIESLLQQDYPVSDMEWIFVDGMSKDNTVELIDKYRKEYPDLIKIFYNSNKIVPYAMNIGIQNSVGKYIVRLDAHASYENDYISKCVYYLDNVDADNVGGLAETKSRGYIGGAIAQMLSSKFGVGNSQFRTNGKSGYVDTVPFGAFRREVFSNVGGYDERLVRNQDNEMNYRIRKNGGKIYLSEEIRFSYYCRDTVKGITKMAIQNGKWNVITMHLCPKSMGLRHFIPMIFVLSLILLGIGGLFMQHIWWLLGIEGTIYLSLDFLFSIKDSKKFVNFFAMIWLFPLFHICYGIGSCLGLFSLFRKKYKKKGYEPKKI